MSDYSLNVPDLGVASLYGNPSETSEITNLQSHDELQVRFHLDENMASDADTSFPVTGKKSIESPPVQSPNPSITKFTAETKASDYSASGRKLSVTVTSSILSSASSRKESGKLRVKINSEKGDEASDMSTENLQNLKIDDASANEDEATQSASPPDLDEDTLDSIEENFRNFAKFGDPKSNGKLITLSNSDKWMKQAKIIDGKKVTTTDTGIYFKKLKTQKVPVTQYRTFLEDLAKAKKISVQDIIKKLASCGVPGIHGSGNVKATDAVNRLTDASKYTGTHKQRFDDSGKGKGIAGRKDMVDTSGYVSGYQNKDTFEGRESK